MRLKSGFEGRRVRMEMLPLMDVIFLLLLMFVYASLAMTIHRGLKVELPAADGTLVKVEPLVITLTASDQLAFNGRFMELEELVQATVSAWRSQTLPVLISADRAASLGIGIELLGRLKDGGVEQVAFQVEKH